MNNVINELKGVTSINNEYIILVILSIAIIIGFKLINKIFCKLYSLTKHSSKNIFKFNQFLNLLSNVIIFLSIFMLWEGHLKNIVTIISFISAGATIALREVVLNLTAGIYIKLTKPFAIEDRIELAGIKGDVVLISSMSFKVLELGDRLNGEQSSGIIVNIPNSKIFSEPLKNYTTAFKYIWSELVVNVDFTSNIDQTKKILYKIVNNNEVIKAIPKKMDKAIDDACGTYRIYYNNLKPIIYTEYKDNHIEFTIRFLVHPKKERNVINDLWLNIIKEAQAGKINLLHKN